MVILVLLLLVGRTAAGTHDRYFVESHGVGANYLALRGDGTYVITGREDMGLVDVEAGRWTSSGERITFTPSGRAKQPYDGVEVSYRHHTFLAFDSEDAAGLKVPIDDTRKQLDTRPRRLPDYVFFEIDRQHFERGTKER